MRLVFADVKPWYNPPMLTFAKPVGYVFVLAVFCYARPYQVPDGTIAEIHASSLLDQSFDTTATGIDPRRAIERSAGQTVITAKPALIPEV